MIEIHGTPMSRAVRPLWVAEEADAEYRLRPVVPRNGDARTPEYRRINPNAKVPAMVHGDVVLFESGAICEYIAAQYPVAGLLPAYGTPEWHHHQKWMFWVVSELEQPLWTMGKHRFALPEPMRVPAMLEVAAKEWTRPAKVLADALAEREYMLGDRFSVADVMVGHTLSWARGFGVPLGHDVLEGYADRVLSRPALARARKAEPTPAV